MKTLSDIRSEFLTYFDKQGHQIVPSAPLIPQNDPTLMFIAAGMVPFKNLFTGAEKRNYTRATSSQKCVRAGGKHNDLENVGYTARHHTFFEMLGNFSFGDYFKEEAIYYGWQLVTKYFGLPKDRLLVTVYADDEETAQLWKKIAGLPDDKIIRIATDDNFWSMGDTGPCGPCSEIFYDHGADIAGGIPGSPDEDGDRFVEIWNLVFMQYETLPDGTRIDLPNPCIDTGMGLERISAIMQGTHNNYEIDLFRKIISGASDIVSAPADGDALSSYRVIADHLRASAFLMSDGVMPSNEGRGYVLRRIMRRGMRHAHVLGAQDPLMYKLVPILTSLMGDAYPDLKRGESLITETLKNEETKFKTTLDRGLKLLEEETSTLSSGGALDGKTAFKLYDTYGFPLDLIQDALKSKGLSVDINGFNAAMEEQRAAARKSWSGSGDATTDAVWFDIANTIKPTEFLGYGQHQSEGQILAIIKDGKQVDEAAAGDTVSIIANQSPFYAEAGGQVGDTGTINNDQGQMIVTDTQKKVGKLWVHIGTIENGTLNVDDGVQMTIDTNRRNAIHAHHSATHLLHKALQDHLGDHVMQKGSHVSDTRIRFDISQPKAISAAELSAIERKVNEEIWLNTDIVTRLMDKDQAMESGAMALFGEKYDDEVRVVSMGSITDNGNAYSVELCGGTHADRTGEIGLFKITGESAVSSGVRRIEAVAQHSAFEYLLQDGQYLASISAALKTPKDAALDRIETLLAERKQLEQQVSNLRKELATGGASSAGGDADDSITEINGIRFKGQVLADYPAKDLKPMVDDLKQKIESGVIALIATNDGKASIVVGVTKDLTGKISAVDLVRIGSEALGGKGGGGRPDMAQAGGPNAGAANSALDKIQKAL